MGILAAFSAAPDCRAESPAREVVISSLSGTVDYMKGGQGEWVKASSGDVLQETDIVRTGENSTCALIFKGMSDAAVDMRPDSVMELSTVSDKKGDSTELGLSIGSVLVKAEKLKGESSFQVRTPNSIVGIRGTQFEVNVD